MTSWLNSIGCCCPVVPFQETFTELDTDLGSSRVGTTGPTFYLSLLTLQPSPGSSPTLHQVSWAHCTMSSSYHISADSCIVLLTNSCKNHAFVSSFDAKDVAQAAQVEAEVQLPLCLAYTVLSMSCCPKNVYRGRRHCLFKTVKLQMLDSYEMLSTNRFDTFSKPFFNY